MCEHICWIHGKRLWVYKRTIETFEAENSLHLKTHKTRSKGAFRLLSRFASTINFKRGLADEKPHNNRSLHITSSAPNASIKVAISLLKPANTNCLHYWIFPFLIVQSQMKVFLSSCDHRCVKSVSLENLSIAIIKFSCVLNCLTLLIMLSTNGLRLYILSNQKRNRARWDKMSSDYSTFLK